MRLAILACLAALASPALAQDITAARPTEAQDEADTDAAPGAIWVAGVSGGYLDRQAGPGSPYVTASVTRYKVNSYIRAAATIYRSTLRQPDAALPSTFVIGSLGYGGNWDGWVLDLYGSFGRQKFGQVVTDLGARDSSAGTGSTYLAGGMRAGRVFRLGGRSSLSATGSVQYVVSRSLRHLIGPAGPQDAQIPDRAISSSAALRFDRKVGKRGQHSLAFTAEHFETNNGSTIAVVDAPAFDPAAIPQPLALPASVIAQRTPDGWDEIGVGATFQLGDSLWLDLEAKRSFGVVAGDSVSSTAGLRWRF